MEQSPSSTSTTVERDPSIWGRLRKRLGFAAVNNGNGNGSHRPKPKRCIANEVPEFLELGPQRYGDPGFWIPEVDGPLLENDDYRRALRTLGEMELPSETIAKRQQR